MSEMKDGMKDGMSGMKDGMSGMKDEMSEMKDGMSGMKDGMSEMNEKLNSIEGVLTQTKDTTGMLFMYNYTLTIDFPIQFESCVYTI
jgi:archaellum component FlaC